MPTFEGQSDESFENLSSDLLNNLGGTNWKNFPEEPDNILGRLFLIEQDVIEIAQNGLDDIIDQLGKTCLLYYPAISIPCNNCLDSLPPGSGNKWITGGPAPQRNQSCQSCGGTGSKFVEPREEVKLLIAWEPRDFYIKMEDSDMSISAPTGKIQTKGYLRNLHKIMRANYMVVQTDISGMVRMKFERDGEPADPSNIVKNRYFVINWKRVP